MSIKFITSIYSDLYGNEYGGRVNRGGHYRYSLLSLLKMTDADFLCYTSDRELDSLIEFFYNENNISPEKLKFQVFDISQTKFKDLINQYKNIDETKKSDRCIEIQYVIEDTGDKFLILGKENDRNYWSGTVDRKWYKEYDRGLHIIGGLFGGHKSKWDEVVSLFEDYVEKIINEDKGIPHEEHIMTLMFYNHKELFERKHFDIWWCRDNAPRGTSEELFQQNKSFYKILEEFNRIYE